MERINWEFINFYELETILRIAAQDKSDPNQVLGNCYTPICLVCKFKREDLLAILLQHGAKTDTCTTAGGKTPLHFASCHKDRNRGMVKMLLEAKAEINAQDRFGNTSLHLACKKANIPVAKLLIEYGANLSLTNIDRETPLIIACVNNYVELVDLLLKAGSDPDEMESFAMRHAIHSSSVDLCRRLAQAGADLNNEKIDVFNYACHIGNNSVIKVLLENGARVNQQNCKSWSPLHFACYNDSSINIQLLLDWGADVQAITDSGSTALHLASEMLNVDSIKVLLAHGANANARDHRGRTPIYRLLDNIAHYASVLDNMVLVMQLLRAAGCKYPHYCLINIHIPMLLPEHETELNSLLEVNAYASSNPLNLQSQCRIAIRKCVRRNIDINIDKLPLPPQIIRFMKFNDI